MAGARVGEETMKRVAGVDFDVESASRREGDPAASAWARKVKIYTRAVGLLSSAER
jgi:UDP-glucose 4-epimerase